MKDIDAIIYNLYIIPRHKHRLLPAFLLTRSSHMANVVETYKVVELKQNKTHVARKETPRLWERPQRHCQQTLPPQIHSKHRNSEI